MAKHNETGKLGELLAKEFLEEKNFGILEVNWRYKRAEIDIIAKEEETLVFVEVKTRSSESFGRPEEFVSKRKMRFMADAASAYMEQINHAWAIRFDIISVLLPKDRPAQIEHFPDAFFPDLFF